MNESADILIVDDDANTCLTLAGLFQQIGYETETAHSGREALAKASERFFNVVLLDIRLPDAPGVDIIAPLRGVQPDTVVIMTTAYASLDTAVQALNTGATSYLTKPLNLDEVQAAIRDVVEKQRLVFAKRQADAEIRRLNEEIEERVRRRTAELNAANKELEAFAYSISHDLRSPLRAVGGFARILADEYADRLPPDAQHYLQLLQSGAQEMDNLINGLLALSRLGRQALEVQPVNPAEIVREAIDALSVEQDGRQVTITVDDLPPCRGDPTLLKQVYLNLLSNALKFTRGRDEAAIRVGCQWGGEVPDETIYFVKDNGVGFDAKYADKLFGVFQRLHRAEDFEGTGVGLAIVQRIVRRHNGRVWAEAEVDRGATFYFTLGDPPTTNTGAG